MASSPRKGSTALQVLEGAELSGKYALVTGANSGIGFETVRALAIHNAHVVIACRNVVAASEAKDRILNEKEDADIAILPLDLNELQSVEECANQYLQSEKPLNILVLNAGVYNPKHRVTDAGFEATFQINHLAQFYLTKLLEPRLVSSAPARVVVVSSMAVSSLNVRSLRPNQITWDRFSPTHKNHLNSAGDAYAVSKFASALFASHLNKRLKDQGVHAFSLHPGIIKTEIGRNSSLLKTFLGFWGKPFTINVEKGAATSVYCAIWPGLEKDGGKYFSNLKVNSGTAATRNEENAEAFWKLSEEMIEHYKKTADSV